MDFSRSIALAKVGIILRNEGSYLGFLWNLFTPFAMFGVLYVVFSQNVGGQIEQYPLYLLIGVVMFSLFRQTTTQATRLLYNYRGVITSINFPKYTLIGGLIMQAAYFHMFEVLVFTIFLFITGVFQITSFLYFLVLICFLLFIYGIALLLAITTAYIPDTEHLWAAASHALWFLTPIFYSETTFTHLAVFNTINPLYYYIAIARDVVLYGKIPDSGTLVIVFSITCISVVIGQIVFNSFERRLSEHL